MVGMTITKQDLAKAQNEYRTLMQKKRRSTVDEAKLDALDFTIKAMVKALQIGVIRAD